MRICGCNDEYDILIVWQVRARSNAFGNAERAQKCIVNFDGLANIFVFYINENRNVCVNVCVYGMREIFFFLLFRASNQNGKKKANGALNIQNLHAHPYIRITLECHRIFYILKRRERARCFDCCCCCCYCCCCWCVLHKISVKNTVCTNTYASHLVKHWMCSFSVALSKHIVYIVHTHCSSHTSIVDSFVQSTVYSISQRSHSVRF